jgi:hypothetical protein
MAHGEGVEFFASGAIRHEGQWIEDSMDYSIPSDEERRMRDGNFTEPIPLLVGTSSEAFMELLPLLVGISSDTSSENAQMPSRSASGTKTSPVGTYNNDIQEGLTSPCKSNCTVDDISIPADDEDPSFYYMLQCMFDSERSIDVATEEKEALELDESRPENGSNEAPHLVMSPAVNDVLCGKGGKTENHNLHYTRLCAQVADEYDAAKKRGWSGKKGVALRVVRDVQQSGGRFLKPAPAAIGWDVMSEETSVDKAAHCIRDVIHRRRTTKRRTLGEGFI